MQIQKQYLYGRMYHHRIGQTWKQYQWHLSLLPIAGGKCKCILSCMTFKGVEFDPFKIRVV